MRASCLETRISSGGTTMHVLGADTLGGCESLSLSLARALSSAGHTAQEVLFLSPLTGLISPQFEAAGVVVHSFPGLGRIRFMRAFSDLCRRRKVTTVLPHGFGQHAFTAMAAAQVPGCKTFPLVGNPAPAEWGRRIRTALYAQLARPFVSQHIACSGHVARSMQSAYGIPASRIEVVHNWCDAGAVRAEASIARSARRRDDRQPIIGMVARLDPIKDHDTVIRAFALLKPRLQDARLRLIGDGVLRAPLAVLAKSLDVADSVEFTGNRTDVAAQLGGLDLFCYATTQQEGFGIVLIEAMAAGVPIVCTDVGPCREVLHGGDAGLLVPPENPHAMAQALANLWTNRARREQLVEEASRLVDRDYTSSAAAARIARLIAG